MHTKSRHRYGGHKSELVWDLYKVQQPSTIHWEKQQTTRPHQKQQKHSNGNVVKQLKWWDNSENGGEKGLEWEMVSSKLN